MTGNGPKPNNHTDLLFLGGIVGILLVMILPLPSIVLDLFLAFSIAFSLGVLLIAMYTHSPVEFSVFPPLLLVVTLGRLALNVASTRLILLEGYAGEVIQTFGRFVVGGNFVVGLVIFSILVLIQFVVITNGAGRVAEVAARFTLDALPGKQMSIDADMSAGAISKEEAQARRKEVEQESEFYGAMDGAAKFVKGDAIASVVITLINIFGGFFIGVFQKGLPWMESIERYTLLTIGDGLVGQISALLVSTATGLIVTRAASDAHLGEDLSRGLLFHPAALGRLGYLLLGFVLIPGMPKIPFLVLAAGAIWGSRKQAKRVEETALVKVEEETAVVDAGPEDVGRLLPLEALELQIGYGLVKLVDEKQDGSLLTRVVGVRRTCATDLGIIVPPIRIRDDLSLKAGGYRLRLYGQTVGSGEVYPGRLLAMVAAEETDIPGISVKEPAFGLPALWIEEQQEDLAEIQGHTVVDPASVIATHLSEILKAKAGMLIGRDEIHELLGRVKEQHPKLVAEVVPEQVDLTKLRKVLRNLLDEGISIRDLRGILEALADHSANEADPAWLTEKVRETNSHVLLRELSGLSGTLQVVALSPALEEVVAELLPGGSGLGPQEIRSVMHRISEGLSTLVRTGAEPVVISSQRVRPLVRKILERAIPGLVVVCFEEIPRDLVLDTVAVVEAGNLARRSGAPV